VAGSSVVVLGIELEKRSAGDIIRADDDNKKRDALLKILEKLEEYAAVVVFDRAEIVTSLSDLRDKTESLPVVSFGDYVFAEHHNTIINILSGIADVLSLLFGEILAVEEIKSEAQSLQLVGRGNMVSASLHNSIVEILKKIADLLERYTITEVVLWDDVEVKLYLAPEK